MFRQFLHMCVYDLRCLHDIHAAARPSSACGVDDVLVASRSGHGWEEDRLAPQRIPSQQTHSHDPISNELLHNGGINLAAPSGHTTFRVSRTAPTIQSMLSVGEARSYQGVDSRRCHASSSHLDIHQVPSDGACTPKYR